MISALLVALNFYRPCVICHGGLQMFQTWSPGPKKKRKGNGQREKEIWLNVVGNLPLIYHDTPW